MDIVSSKYIDFNEAMLRAAKSKLFEMECTSNFTFLHFLLLHVAACLICSGTRPFRVLFVNRAFTRLTGYEQHDVEGETLEFLHGDLSDPRKTYKVCIKTSIRRFFQLLIMSTY